MLNNILKFKPKEAPEVTDEIYMEFARNFIHQGLIAATEAQDSHWLIDEEFFEICLEQINYLLEHKRKRMREAVLVSAMGRATQ